MNVVCHTLISSESDDAILKPKSLREHSIPLHLSGKRRRTSCLDDVVQIDEGLTSSLPEKNNKYVIKSEIYVCDACETQACGSSAAAIISSTTLSQFSNNTTHSLPVNFTRADWSRATRTESFLCFGTQTCRR